MYHTTSQSTSSAQILAHNRQLLKEAVESLEAAGMPLPASLQVWKTAEIDISRRENAVRIEELINSLHVAEQRRKDADARCIGIREELKRLGWEG